MPREKLPRELVCQVEGCREPLGDLKVYHKRYKICLTHLRSPELLVKGQWCRFCQQCGRFHGLEEFEGAKRSCRARLERHNRRRRVEGVAEEEMEDLEDIASQAGPAEGSGPAVPPGSTAGKHGGKLMLPCLSCIPAQYTSGCIPELACSPAPCLRGHATCILNGGKSAADDILTIRYAQHVEGANYGYSWSRMRGVEQNIMKPDGLL